MCVCVCVQGVNRERAPFVLTPDFEYVMGKRVSMCVCVNVCLGCVGVHVWVWMCVCVCVHVWLCGCV